MNEELQSMQNKCPHCRIDFFPPADNTVECPRCGLADTMLILKDYDKFTDSYSTPSKQVFDHEKHFANWMNNILGISFPKKDIIPLLKDYFKKNNISKEQISINGIRQVLKHLKLPQYYKFTSYFYKEITGNELPFISRDIINRAKWYFQQFFQQRKCSTPFGRSML